ncbi:MAG: low molecular weight phosphotyrosine protein phosphatase [Muribaculaceae bacterium]|nr:low molecular weight phosphotyrosine protein phosphatase [Muribaculaceae bacterium]
MTTDTNPRRKVLTDRLCAILAQGRPVRILFVCLGNICRSPAAEGVMIATVDALGTSALWQIDSAGTGDYHIGDLADPRMRTHASRRGLKLLHRARQVSSSDLDYFDMVIAMDHSNLRNLRAISPTVETDSKIMPMAAFFPGGDYAPVSETRNGEEAMPGATDGYDHVPDPYYSGAEGFELVLDMLEIGCMNIATLIP